MRVRRTERPWRRLARKAHTCLLWVRPGNPGRFTSAVLWGGTRLPYTIRRHGRDYWQAVAQVMPDYERRREEPRRCGAGLAWQRGRRLDQWRPVTGRECFHKGATWVRSVLESPPSALLYLLQQMVLSGYGPDARPVEAPVYFRAAFLWFGCSGYKLGCAPDGGDARPGVARRRGCTIANYRLARADRQIPENGIA